MDDGKTTPIQRKGLHLPAESRRSPDESETPAHPTSNKRPVPVLSPRQRIAHAPFRILPLEKTAETDLVENTRRIGLHRFTRPRTSLHGPTEEPEKATGSQSDSGLLPTAVDSPRSSRTPLTRRRRRKVTSSHPIGRKKRPPITKSAKLRISKTSA